MDFSQVPDAGAAVQVNDAPVELVVAVSQNNVIGRGGTLPWRLPADLRHFRSLTLGHHVLMGRKTYDSIGKALPSRTNLVLSQSPLFRPGDARVVRSLGEAQQTAGSHLPLMVIGGAQIYRLALPFVRRIHLTLVHGAVHDGDTFFSDWRGPDWCEAEREDFAADASHPYAYSFLTLQRQDAARRG